MQFYRSQILWTDTCEKFFSKQCTMYSQIFPLFLPHCPSYLLPLHQLLSYMNKVLFKTNSHFFNSVVHRNWSKRTKVTFSNTSYVNLNLSLFLQKIFLSYEPLSTIVLFCKSSLVQTGDVIGNEPSSFASSWLPDLCVWNSPMLAWPGWKRKFPWHQR
jgi:hypothetical protein